MLPLNTARDAVLAYQNSQHHACIPRDRPAARIMPWALVQPREKLFCLHFNGSLVMSSGQQKSNVHLLEPGGRIATATCRETANPAGWVLALCSHHLLMEHSSHQRKTLDYHSLFSSLARSSSPTKAIHCSTMPLQHSAHLWRWIGFHEFPPLTSRCVPWDSTICSPPCACNSQHAADAATCLVVMQTGLW